jgi:hypothetical protein
MAYQPGQLNTVIRTFTNEIQGQIAQAVLDATRFSHTSPPPFPSDQ